jgi:hypothetical protein
LENTGYNNDSVGDMEKEWMDGLAGRAPQVPSPKIKYKIQSEMWRGQRATELIVDSSKGIFV